ncbi:MAG: Sulfoxide reductase catalytic subunit YedY [Verrucomicrobia subdivision 3 bacterium]|nr:Sulfoxide reductase catalytic subunit YedY [Limisphaerales bacterium]MCS1414738.1 Sulfoxide reductase catalytic subunit YedY [Limisphaerales bacterium]
MKTQMATPTGPLAGTRDPGSDSLARTVQRRDFFKSLAAALGTPIVFSDRLPPSDFPAALAQEAARLVGVPDSKRQLTILSDRPLNAETPAHLLDDDITPNHLHFVRNNGHIPERAFRRDHTGWQLQIDGEIQRPRNWSLEALKREFEQQEAQITIECAGNGRAGYHPNVSGNQWTLGAVGCARYRGTRLADVLNASGTKDSAVYIGYYGEDPHLSRNPKRDSISRGVPIEKALDPHTLLAWEMNGQPLPAEHGFPLRLICPGWPGSTCGKWLRRIWVRARVHDGTKMTGSSYHVPKYPVAPGATVPNEDMEIITLMPVKSLITRPKTGITTAVDQPLKIRGKAWSGTGRVQRVDVTFDFGSTWQTTNLAEAPNRYAWQHWTVRLKFPKRGYYEVWARATDDQGRAQPMIVPGWNPKGYLNNAMHRVAVRAS